MKKILSLILSLVMVAFMLVSCGDDDIEDDIPSHYPPLSSGVKDIGVDLYIIYGEQSNANAIQTVRRQIAAETLKKYHTELSVKYITAAEYENEVMARILNPDATEEARGTVVLVHRPEFMERLEGTGLLLDLSGYLNMTKFGSINVTVPESLLAAAKGGTDSLYAIPNSHVLGEYTYLVINEEVARENCNYGLGILSSYKSYADTEQLRDDMAARGFDPNKFVTTVTGTYATKAELEADGNICNVISVPQISSAYAFKSAFAIVDSGDEEANERAMQMIYALNVDAELRNLLQYGVKNTNYFVDAKTGYVTLADGIDMYVMNYIYTGNAFILSYCDQIGWTEEYAATGKHQNVDSVYSGG